MKAERSARRHPASAFPGITGVRLTPPNVAATLVNLSATGILVHCASRPDLGGRVTVHLAGTFVPASIDARVVRCEVAGISPDGSLRYHLGLGFSERITLPDGLEEGEAQAAAAAGIPPGVAAPASAPVLRNRW